jgi:hypothetical protein
MTPAQYLEKFCRLNDRRRTLYRKLFDKYKIKSDKEDYINLKVCSQSICF